MVQDTTLNFAILLDPIKDSLKVLSIHLKIVEVS